MSAITPTDTQRQFSSRISCHSSVQLTPCKAHAKHATETTSVIAVNMWEARLDSCGGEDMCLQGYLRTIIPMRI